MRESMIPQHDIALLRVRDHIELHSNSSGYVLPVCLPEPWEDFEGRDCITTGWGFTRLNGNSVNELRKVVLKVISK